MGFCVETHVSVHVAPDAQDSEHEPLHVMEQVEPAAHVTLPLSPTVAVQLAFAAHSTLHDLPQLPVQLDDSAQLSEQLSADSHWPKLH